jgi:hypothetical protein
MKIGTALIVGLGGTGSNLVETAVRLLTYHADGTKKIILADLDFYEEKNATRQFFHDDQIGKNKAIATAERLSGFPHLIAEDRRIDRGTLSEMIAKYHTNKERMFLIITAVDNDATRKQIIETLDDELPNYILINPGNGTEVVDVSVHVVVNGEALTAHPFERYNNLREPEDQLPGSCGEVAISAPQTITANMLAATGVILYLTAILDGQSLPNAISGNIRKFGFTPSAGKGIKLS